jgi:hypothetical protein
MSRARFRVVLSALAVVFTLLVGVDTMCLAVPRLPPTQEQVPLVRRTTREWMIKNNSQQDLRVWFRVIDAPECLSADISGDGSREIRVRGYASFSMKVSWLSYPEAPRPSPPMLRVLVAFQPTEKDHTAVQGVVRDVQIQDGETPTVLIDDGMLAQRQDVLFVQNASSEDVELRLSDFAVPNPLAKAGIDYELSHLGRMKDDTMVVPAGKSVPWLILRHSGAVGAGDRSVRCAMTSKTYSGWAGIGWSGYVTSTVCITDDSLARLAAIQSEERKAIADSRANAQIVQDEHAREHLREAQKRYEEAQARAYRHNEDRRWHYGQVDNSNEQAAQVLAGLLILGVFVAALSGDSFGDSAWSNQAAEQERQAQEIRRYRRETYERWVREAQQADEEGRERPYEPPPP